MGKIRQRTRNRSSIDALPEGMRNMVDLWLSDVNISYQEIVDRMHEQGYELSTSAVGRYALRTKAVTMRIQEAIEQTKGIIAAAQSGDALGVSKATTSLIATELAKKIALAQEDIAEMPVVKAMEMAIKLERATVNTKKFEAEYRRGYADAVREVKAELKEALKEHPMLLQEIGTITDSILKAKENKLT